MFRYLAQRHDRTQTLKSLQRQERIKNQAIGFAYDTSLAFSVDGAEDDVARDLAFKSISEGEAFFEPLMPAEPLRVERGRAYFESDIKTLDDQNDIFECVVTDSGSKDHALVVFHHWYARNRYAKFARYFAARGITVIEATLPYHFGRGTDDYSEGKFFNASLGRTLRSMRQAVLDGRKIVRWLDREGYGKISVVGMCLGGTVAGLVAAQENKVDKAVLMVSPMSPADLVWSAETMKALRSRIEAAISLEELRTAWGLVDLEKHTWSLTRRNLDLMFLLGKDDKIALPEKTDSVVETLTKCGRPPEVARLNCGHSSVGVFPYNLIAARKVMRFLKESPTLAELWEARGLRWDLSEGSPRREELAPDAWKDRRD